MNFSKTQVERLTYLLTDQFCVEDDETTDRNLDLALSDIESAEELHQFAANFNRDCGSDVLKKVVRHPLCDKGTLLLIYYFGQPQFFYRRIEQGKAFVGDMKAEFAFLKEIENLIQEGLFHSNRIKVDPTCLGPKRVNCLAKEGSELIPAFMKLPSEGVSVEIYWFGARSNDTGVKSGEGEKGA